MAKTLQQMVDLLQELDQEEIPGVVPLLKVQKAFAKKDQPKSHNIKLRCTLRRR